MKPYRFLMVALGATLALAAGPALARTRRHAAPACCIAVAGTPVEVELAEPVGTKTHHAGDHIALRLAEPLIVNGQVVLSAGAVGEGEVIAASRPGLGGKSAKIVLAARYLNRDGPPIPLKGLQLAAAGKGRVMAAQAVGLTGFAFAPLGFAALAVSGGDVAFPAGLRATAKLAVDVRLAPLRPATRDELADAADSADDAAAVSADQGALIAVPPPPPGQGQVVFFRPHTLLGTGQWFNVREDGHALGRLVNGAYFIQVTEPGVHTYTAKLEPEFKDSLKLQIDPGETYFVEGELTKGVVVGAADLTPSDRAAFDKAAKGLKLAPPPEPDGKPLLGGLPRPEEPAEPTVRSADR